MALLISTADLKTHIYGEIVEEITREDQGIQEEAVTAGIDEAKGYLDKYDLVALFGTETADPTVRDSNLKSKVKDLVKWNLIKLGYKNIDYATVQAAYEYAVKYYFEKIQAGKLVPDGWPYRDYSTAPELPQGNGVHWSANTKRRNHF